MNVEVCLGCMIQRIGSTSLIGLTLEPCASFTMLMRLSVAC